MIKTNSSENIDVNEKLIYLSEFVDDSFASLLKNFIKLIENGLSQTNAIKELYKYYGVTYNGLK